MRRPTQQTLLGILVAITILVPTALGHAQGAPDPRRAADACTALGGLFYETTDARDRGVSLKDDLDLAAKAAQTQPDPRMSPLVFVQIYTMVAANARWHPEYQHLGPAMNKLRAEARCTRIGPKAFFAELEAFRKILLKQ